MAGSVSGPPDAVSLALEALGDVAGDAELICDVAEQGRCRRVQFEVGSGAVGPLLRGARGNWR